MLYTDRLSTAAIKEEEQTIELSKMIRVHLGGVVSGVQSPLGNGFRSFRERVDLHKNVVDGDVDQLDDEANDAHDKEACANGLGDLQELWMCDRIKQWLKDVVRKQGDRAQ